MNLVVALLSGGFGLALGAVVALVITSSEGRRARASTDARLERIEHILTAPDQAWFWTPEWQAGEAEADADVAAGRSTVHASEDEFFAALDAIPASDEPSRTGR